MPKRVMFGSNVTSDPHAGVAGTILSLGNELAERQFDVSYAWAPATSRLGPRVDRQLVYVRLAATIARGNPDVAIVSSGDGLLVTGSRIPLVMHSHGLEHQARRAQAAAGVRHNFGVGHRWLREPAVKWTARRAAALVLQNEAERQFAITELDVSPRRAVVIHNAIEEPFFAVRRDPTERPTVVWIGSWLERKGSSWLPQVLLAMVASNPDILLHLVGTGAAETTVRGAFPDAVQHALGVTPRADRTGVMRACSTATVGLSTSAFEGFGRNIVEMLACGLPVVATPTGIAPEIVRANYGTLVPYGDTRAMAEAVGQWLNQPAIGAREAAAPFTWRQVGELWEQLLRGL